ncbi:hypothetical protein G6F24_014044 [Rhizopus arrhizus]|nr:hypothetical protein G6F24_014044 [Rhizopus arrhizus]
MYAVSSAATAAGPGPRVSPARAPRSTSPYPVPQEITHEGPAADPPRRGQPQGCRADTGRAVALPAAERCHPCTRRRRSAGLPALRGQVRRRQPRWPGGGAAGPEAAQGERPGGSGAGAWRPAAEQYPAGDADFLPRGTGSGAQLRTGRECFRGQAGRFQGILRCHPGAGHVLGHHQPAAAPSPQWIGAAQCMMDRAAASACASSCWRTVRLMRS